MFGWIREGTDHISKQQDGAWPAMGQDNRQGVRMPRAYVNAVNAETIDCGPELGHRLSSDSHHRQS